MLPVFQIFFFKKLLAAFGLVQLYFNIFNILVYVIGIRLLKNNFEPVRQRNKVEKKVVVLEQVNTSFKGMYKIALIILGVTWNFVFPKIKFVQVFFIFPKS